MTRFFDDKIVFYTVCVLFALALVWNVSHGMTIVPGSHAVTTPESQLTAHGASAPPDPWEGIRIAHGASAPPDPWEGVTIAHGASAPPDPWEGVTIAHGASAPPDPWESVRG